MRRKHVSDADRRSAASAERRRPGPASAGPEGSAVDRQHALVCPACENITMTERDGARVCGYCGYTGGGPES